MYVYFLLIHPIELAMADLAGKGFLFLTKLIIYGKDNYVVFGI